MGGPKALLPLGDSTFLRKAVSAVSRPGVDSVVVVLGHEAARVRAEGGVSGEVRIIENPAYREGMLTSVWAGLTQAETLAADALLLHLVDHPLVDPATVDRVVATLRSGATIVVPVYAGRRGHPAGFARSAWGPLRSVKPHQGARGVLADHPDWIVHVEGDPGCIAGIDTPEDYRRFVLSANQEGSGNP